MSDDNVTRRMGKLLRQGAALLNKACPKCNTPLLRLSDGKMYCAKCDKEVVEDKSDQPSEAIVQERGDILSLTATKILENLEILIRKHPAEPHPQEIQMFASSVKDLLMALQSIRNLQLQN
jgi:uncharacterized Zn finger protein (UPF0148 family)